MAEKLKKEKPGWNQCWNRGLNSKKVQKLKYIVFLLMLVLTIIVISQKSNVGVTHIERDISRCRQRREDKLGVKQYRYKCHFNMHVGKLSFISFLGTNEYSIALFSNLWEVLCILKRF